MFPRHLEHEIAILAVMCTVALFFFPAASGPYSAVHGPVTALLSLRMRLKFWLGMAQAALRGGGVVFSSLFTVLQAAWKSILPPRSGPPEQNAVLRC